MNEFAPLRQLNRFPPRVARGDPLRSYRHINPSAHDPNPIRTTRARIADTQVLRAWASERHSSASARGAVTVTFVVDLAGDLWVANRHSEHFACAGGNDVLSAGEMTFDISADRVEVSEATNQSLGYCPEPQSWSAVARALDAAGIPHPGGFTTALTFRRCTDCGSPNIVKDNDFVCGVCGADLPFMWNFASTSGAGGYGG